MSKPKRRRSDAPQGKAGRGKPRKASDTAGVSTKSDSPRKRRSTGENHPSSQPAKSTVDFTGVKAFEGSRTHRKRREQLPTDWPSKPNGRDQYDWFSFNEGDEGADVASTSTCTVYVPAAEATAIVGAGSAMVGTPQGPHHVLVDFEDGRYAPAAYADLCDRAYGRHSQRYPTVARLVVSNDLIVAVGTFDPHTGTVAITNPEAFQRWTGITSTTLVTTEGPAVRRRQWQEFLANRPDVAAVPALRRQYACSIGIED